MIVTAPRPVALLKVLKPDVLARLSEQSQMNRPGLSSSPACAPRSEPDWQADACPGVKGAHVK
jgi:hypothetical protein